MGKIGFCSEVSSLKFPFHSQEEKHCICHYGVCPFAQSSAAPQTTNFEGPNCFGKTIYNGKRRNLMRVAFETLGRAA
jgi:hypothetical protein